ERFVGVLKDRSGDVGKPIALTGSADIALPLTRHRLDRENLIVVAARAMDALRPAASDQIIGAMILIWKRRIKLGFRHLRDWVGTPSHCRSPMQGRMA